MFTRIVLDCYGVIYVNSICLCIMNIRVYRLYLCNDIDVIDIRLK